MLRITTIAPLKDAIILRLEGQIAGRWVKELEFACAKAHTGGESLILDLSDVSFIDDSGLIFLQGVAGLRATLINPSPFIAELLKGAGL